MEKCISDMSLGGKKAKPFKNPVDAYDSIKYDMDNNLSSGFEIDCSEMSYNDRIKLCRWINSLVCKRMGKTIHAIQNGFIIEQ